MLSVCFAICVQYLKLLAFGRVFTWYCKVYEKFDILSLSVHLLRCECVDIGRQANEHLKQLTVITQCKQIICLIKQHTSTCRYLYLFVQYMVGVCCRIKCRMIASLQYSTSFLSKNSSTYREDVAQNIPRQNCSFSEMMWYFITKCCVIIYWNLLC